MSLLVTNAADLAVETGDRVIKDGSGRVEPRPVHIASGLARTIGYGTVSIAIDSCAGTRRTRDTVVIRSPALRRPAPTAHRRAPRCVRCR